MEPGGWRRVHLDLNLDLNVFEVSLLYEIWVSFPSPRSSQVEERLTFLSEGTTPRKNLEVMQEAIKEASASGSPGTKCFFF